MVEFRNLLSAPRFTMVSVLPEQPERMRCWRAEHGQSVAQKTVCNRSTKYNPGMLPLDLYQEESDSNISLKDLNSFDSAIQRNNTSSSKTIHSQLGMIVCIKSKHLKISKLKETVFIDQNGHMVPGKVKAESFRRDAFLANRFSEGPEEVVVTKDILCLVENTSITGEEELEIEEETFYDLQAIILNSQDQITEVESKELDAEEQPNVRRSTCSKKGRKQDAFDCFLYDDYDDMMIS